MINKMILKRQTLLMIISCLLLVMPHEALAQGNFTLSRNIKDSATGELLIGASVRIQELPQKGTSSNNYGFYSIVALKGEYTLVCTYIGYQAIVTKVSLNKNTNFNISLTPKSELKEVVVSSNKPNNDQLASPQMGVEKLNMEQINNVPVVPGGKGHFKNDHADAWY